MTLRRRFQTGCTPYKEVSSDDETWCTTRCMIQAVRVFMLPGETEHDALPRNYLPKRQSNDTSHLCRGPWYRNIK